MKQLIVVGGGAAGYFGAIQTAEALLKNSPPVSCKISLFESTPRPLKKVRISGGGRCNVTHACFDPKRLVQNYPRGARELLSVFTQFQPQDMIQWLDQHQVVLKTESDGRMFPLSDSSETIAQCLENTAHHLGVQVHFNMPVKDIEVHDSTSQQKKFKVTSQQGLHFADALLIATGSSLSGHHLAKKLGHTITPLAPSLFTFNIQDPRLQDLAGVSFEQVELNLSTPPATFKSTGPLLITHWGLSGPSVLKLSALAARELQALHYRTTLKLSLLPGYNADQVSQLIKNFKNQNAKKTVLAHRPFLTLPRRYWERLIQTQSLAESTWAHLTTLQINLLARELTQAVFQVEGKSQNKDEFVTCGGVSLKEVSLKTMESKIHHGLYFAGEILDIDGITGGFNFQNAWSNAFLAGRAIASQLTKF